VEKTSDLPEVTVEKTSDLPEVTVEKTSDLPEVTDKTLLGVSVMVLNATFKKFQLIRGGQFYWQSKPPTCRKQLTNTYSCIEYTSP